MHRKRRRYTPAVSQAQARLVKVVEDGLSRQRDSGSKLTPAAARKDGRRGRERHNMRRSMPVTSSRTVYVEANFFLSSFLFFFFNQES